MCTYPYCEKLFDRQSKLVRHQKTRTKEQFCYDKFEAIYFRKDKLLLHQKKCNSSSVSILQNDNVQSSPRSFVVENSEFIPVDIESFDTDQESEPRIPSTISTVKSNESFELPDGFTELSLNSDYASAGGLGGDSLNGNSFETDAPQVFIVEDEPFYILYHTQLNDSYNKPQLNDSYNKP